CGCDVRAELKFCSTRVSAVTPVAQDFSPVLQVVLCFKWSCASASRAHPSHLLSHDADADYARALRRLHDPHDCPVAQRRRADDVERLVRPIAEDPAQTLVEC